MKRFLLAIIMLLLTSPVHAALDIDVSEPNLEITTGFTGDTLTVFGTINAPGDVIIIVKGPKKQTTIRRKVKAIGLWLNGESITFKNVPGYYNVASSKPIFQIAEEDIRIKNRIGLNALVFETEDEQSPAERARFQEALIQNKQLGGLYSLTPNAITFVNEMLFKTRIYMPANVPVGSYEIEAFLFQNGKIIDQQTHPFQIAQGGLAGDVHDFAFNSPFFYGITAILIALFSSFLAITLLRRE